MRNSKVKPIEKHQMASPLFIRRFVYNLTYGDIVVISAKSIMDDSYDTLIGMINHRAEYIGAYMKQSLDNSNEVRIELVKNEIGKLLDTRKRPVLQGVIPTAIAIASGLIIGFLIGKSV